MNEDLFEQADHEMMCCIYWQTPDGFWHSCHRAAMHTGTHAEDHTGEVKGDPTLWDGPPSADDEIPPSAPVVEAGD